MHENERALRGSNGTGRDSEEYRCAELQTQKVRESERVVGLLSLGLGAMTIDIIKIAKLLKCASDFEKKNGRPPFLKELMQCGFGYHTIEKYLPILIQNGLAELVKDGRGRKLRVTKKGYDFLYSITTSLSFLGLNLDQV